MWVYSGVQCTRGPDPVLRPQPSDSVSVGDVAFAVAQPAVASPRINVNGGSRGIPSARNPRFAAREVVAYVRTISQSRTSSLRPFIPLLLTALDRPFLSSIAFPLLPVYSFTATARWKIVACQKFRLLVDSRLPLAILT